MRVVLDIDGVLWRPGSPLDTVDAECRARSEQRIRPHRTVRGVISSSWRRTAIREQISSLVAPGSGCRIVGRTPWLDGRPGTTRFGERQVFLASLRAEPPGVAIDDGALGYPTEVAESPLLLTDGRAGLSDEAANRLRRTWGAGA